MALAMALLSDLPLSEARGGKGARGAGGGISGYGHRGLYNAAAYEMTWEDIVLAMQLSGMCFGALFALCIVACCAYKICGPAEEEDWGRRYRFSTVKPVGTRIPPEFLREIYTLPAGKVSTAKRTSSIEKKDIPLVTPPMPTSMPMKKQPFPDAANFGMIINNGHPLHRPLPPIPPTALPNGRLFSDDHTNGFGEFNNNQGYDNRSRGQLMSSLSTSRLLNEARIHGVAPRLASYNNNSTLDLTHPQHPMYSHFQNSTRSLIDSRTAIV